MHSTYVIEHEHLYWVESHIQTSNVIRILWITDFVTGVKKNANSNLLASNQKQHGHSSAFQ